MRNLALTSAALCAALLADCSSLSMPSAPAVPAAPVPAQSLAQVPLATGSTRLYVSAGRAVHGGIYNEVDIYSAAPPYTQTGALTTGISSPNGLAVDSAHNLYVSSIGNARILKFAPGATTASMSYRTDLTNPLTLTIDSRDNLWAVNYNPPGEGSSIFEYPAGKTVPALNIFQPGGFEGLAVRPDGVLYAGYNDNNGGTVLRFAAGSKHPQQTGIRIGFAGCVNFDGHGNMLVCDQIAPAINVYAPGSHEPSSIISTGLTDPYQIAFSPDRSKLYVADNASDTVDVYSYPAGSLLGQITRTNTAYGVAIIR